MQKSKCKSKNAKSKMQGLGNPVFKQVRLGANA